MPKFRRLDIEGAVTLSIGWNSSSPYQCRGKHADAMLYELCYIDMKHKDTFI